MALLSGHVELVFRALGVRPELWRSNAFQESFDHFVSTFPHPNYTTTLILELYQAGRSLLT